MLSTHCCLISRLGKKTFALDLAARRYGGKQQFRPNKDETIDLYLKQALMTFDHRKPTKQELEALEIIEITHDEQWDPTKFTEDDDWDGNDDPMNIFHTNVER